MVKKVAELIAEANAAVPRISVEEAQALLGADDVQFVDVRETQELANGRIPGAVHVPRGYLEFYADPQSPSHKPELASGKRLVVYCGSGARSALAAKTLQDLGVPNAINLIGGFKGWREGGGQVER